MRKQLFLLSLLLLMGSATLKGQSPKANKVWEYRPAPGQFVNKLPKYEEGDDAAAMAQKATEYLANDGLISLGGYGGYVTFSFDHPIRNVHGRYNLRILGNAFYANANPNPNAPAEGGSCEPGIVMVSRDANGNGLPDDPWYELAGSEYNSPKTVHNYRITYTRPDDMTKAQNVPWADNQGETGFVLANVYHSQPYYPLWLDESTMVFEGSRLAKNAIDESGQGTYWVLYSYPWGYVDNHPNNDERSNFKIDWAVDAEGNHVNLEEIHFVRVFTGLNQDCGWLGETSTEVDAAYDWNMLGGYDTASICGSSYIWNGKTYTASGDYYHMLRSKAGFDSSATLHLTLNPAYDIITQADACRSYTWEGNTYTQSGTYSKTFTSAYGCDSTVSLSLSIVDSYEQTVYAVSCDGNYEWEGTVYTESGTYTKTLTSAGGCDSTVTLHLYVSRPSNTHVWTIACGGSYTWEGQTYTRAGQYTRTLTSPWGCDSTVTLHLDFADTLRTELWHSACDSYTWEGDTYTKSGTYSKTLKTVDGCDSIVTLHLEVNKIKPQTLKEYACGCFVWGDSTYTQQGTSTSSILKRTFTSASGCDSVVTIIVAWRPSLVSTQQVTACDSYTWGDSTYTQSGTDTKTLKTDCGCDNKVTLKLTIVDKLTHEFAATACDSYTWEGDTYTQSGTYTKTLKAACGCDSVVTLNLMVNSSVNHEFSATACGAYLWNGIAYTASGDYQQVLRTRTGCDSIVTLHLTIAQPPAVAVDTSVCGSYYHGGTTYTQSGRQLAMYGCDSVVELNLTVHPVHNVAFAQTICKSYTWEGETYTVGGIYTKTLTSSQGCDSTVTLDLQLLQPKIYTLYDTVCGGMLWNGQQCSSTGTYSHTITGGAANGCDSIVMLNLQVNPIHTIQLTDSVVRGAGYSRNGFSLTANQTQNSRVHMLYLQSSQGCDSTVRLQLIVLDATAVPTMLAEQVSLYPNPNSGVLQVSGIAPFAQAEVYSTTGQLVYSSNVGHNKLTLNLQHLPAGVYTLRLCGSQGCVTRRFVMM